MKPHRTIRFLLLAVMGLLTVALGYSLLGRPRPSARPLAALETGENVSQRALNLDSTRTRRGLPSFRVTAKEALTYREGGKELHDVVVTLYGPGEDRAEVTAPLALSTEGESGGWSFQNGVEIRGENGLRLHVPDMKYRESLQEIASDGDVSFERGEMKGSARGLRYLVSRRRLEFLSSVEVHGDPNGGTITHLRADSAAIDQGASRETFQNYTIESPALETLAGASLDVLLDPNGTKVRRLQATGGFSMRSAGVPRGTAFLGGGRREMAGASLAVELLANGEVGSALAAGDVRMKTAAEDAGERTLACGRMSMSFAGGKLSAMTAEDGSTLILPRPATGKVEGDTILRASSIQTRFSAVDGALTTGEATGDASVEQAGKRLSAPRIAFDASGSFWVLDAEEPGTVARVEGEGSTLAAAHVEIRRIEGTLNAKGGVKTTTEPGGAAMSGTGAGAESSLRPSSRAAGSFLGGEGPVHGISESLTVTREGRTAKYRDKVRIWQGGSSLEAPSVDLADEAGTVEAHGGVVARAPARKRQAAGLQIITLSATGMSYARSTGEARFTGNVRAQTEGARIDAETLVAKGAGGEGIRELEASGKVRFQQATRSGEGDLLTVFLKEDRYVLSGRGRIVTIQDQSSQQVVKGVVLTYEGAADRILVESETGGRTWITLKPRAAEGKKGGPEPPH